MKTLTYSGSDYRINPLIHNIQSVIHWMLNHVEVRYESIDDDWDWDYDWKDEE